VNTSASTKINGRQYATGVDGTVISFECERAKHAYKVDFSKRSIARRLGPEGCRMMAKWWSREKGAHVGRRCQVSLLDELQRDIYRSSSATQGVAL
jgi:hypothetical protein